MSGGTEFEVVQGQNTPQTMFNLCEYNHSVNLKERLQHLPHLTNITISCHDLVVDEDALAHCGELQWFCVMSETALFLPPGLFRHNPLLIGVDFSGNNITELHEDMFIHNPLLRVFAMVTLRGNKVPIDLPPKLFRNQQLNHLNLSQTTSSQLTLDFPRVGATLTNLNLDCSRLTQSSMEALQWCPMLTDLCLNYIPWPALPDETFQRNLQLQAIAIIGSNLRTLAEDLFKPLIQLQKVFLTNNQQISSLPENLFKHNTALIEVLINCPRLRALPDNIFHHNTALVSLILRYNNLRLLPTSIGNLTNLTWCDITNNPIEHIPLRTHRILNRCPDTGRGRDRHQQDNVNVNAHGVYADSQSVHNHHIQQSIAASIRYIMSVPVVAAVAGPELLRDHILSNASLTETTKRLLIEYMEDGQVHSALNVTFGEVLAHVYSAIISHSHDHSSICEELLGILNAEMSDSRCKCFTGRLSRLINVLNGFDDNIRIEISLSEQISNVIIRLRRRWEMDEAESEPGGEERLKQLVREELRERGIAEQTIEEWIEHI